MDSSKSLDQYTVGWIAALKTELAAAMAMLDEVHEKPHDFVQPRTDTNVYTWGRMGEHNVVVASLPAGHYGTTSAAATALPLLTSFPQIRVGVMVGIGGGIARPRKGRDIRLGDIVVSRPKGGSGGVIQYDLGKAITGNKFENTGFLNSPPEALLKALAKLQALHELGQSKVPALLDEMYRKHPKLKAGFVYQGAENDRLFKAKYDHVEVKNDEDDEDDQDSEDDRACSECDSKQEVRRKPRQSNEPEIHYGTIASGNMVIKDAVKRDLIAQATGEDCICFEMEAAGLVNDFPCLVIRGICDYADSHKNDRWHKYAAATAAAYAKEFLGVVPAAALEETQNAIEVVGRS
jgi:nucleoside phosphorylase